MKIETHNNGHYAINVKCHNAHTWARGLGSEDQRERAWDDAQEEWWGVAESIARSAHYAGVYSEGRSGGWLVPYYDTAGRSRYPDFPRGEPDGEWSEDETAQHAEFVAFAERIGELLKQAPEIFADCLACIIEADDETATDAANATAKQEAISVATAACVAALRELLGVATQRGISKRELASPRAALESLAQAERMP